MSKNTIYRAIYKPAYYIVRPARLARSVASRNVVSDERGQHERCERRRRVCAKTCVVLYVGNALYFPAFVQLCVSRWCASLAVVRGSLGGLTASIGGAASTRRQRQSEPP